MFPHLLPRLLTHGLSDEFFRGLTQQRLSRIARNAFTPALKHHRHGERRYATRLTMPDSTVNALQELTQAAEIDEPRGGVGKCGPEQHMVGLVLTQDIVDEIRGDRHLTAGLFLTRMTPLDQPRDNRANAERSLHQVRFRKPGVEIVAQHVLIEKLPQIETAASYRRAHVVEPPYRKGALVCDEAKGRSAGALKTARQQHAETLMSEASLERIADEIVPLSARKGLDQHLPG